MALQAHFRIGKDSGTSTSCSSGREAEAVFTRGSGPWTARYGAAGRGVSGPQGVWYNGPAMREPRFLREEGEPKRGYLKGVGKALLVRGFHGAAAEIQPQRSEVSDV